MQGLPQPADESEVRIDDQNGTHVDKPTSERIIHQRAKAISLITKTGGFSLKKHPTSTHSRREFVIIYPERAIVR